MATNIDNVFKNHVAGLFNYHLFSIRAKQEKEDFARQDRKQILHPCQSKH